MSKDAEHISISADWRDRKLTAREFAGACYRFLNALKAVSPVFSNLGTSVNDRVVVIQDDLSSFERVMAECLADPDYVYVNPDPTDNSFTLDSSISGGFNVSFFDPDPRATMETGISIRVMAGSYSPYNTSSILIELPPPHATLVENDLTARQLLDVLIDIWSPEFATIYSDELLNKLDPNLENDRACGYLMYFADAGIAVTISNTAIVEPASSGGIVVRIPASPPWAKSADTFRPCFERISIPGILR